VILVVLKSHPQSRYAIPRARLCRQYKFLQLTSVQIFLARFANFVELRVGILQETVLLC
jgi:hypothetical protein